MTKTGTGSFDPAAHLTKQGWKGKGTALKSGHAVRPLAVVQKKSLSGIGKDRDEAVPFWDNIFAATAASLSLPSSTAASPAPSPGPCSLPMHTDHTSTKSWATLAPHGTPSVGSTSVGPKIPSLSIAARSGKEFARRGLYSRFLRGATLSWEPSPEPEEKEEVEVTVHVSVQGEAGPSSASKTSSGEGGGERKGKGREKGGESKMERKARRAVQKARKAEKEAKRARKEARRAEREAKRAEKDARPAKEGRRSKEEAATPEAERLKTQGHVKKKWNATPEGVEPEPVSKENGDEGKKRKQRRKEEAAGNEPEVKKRKRSNKT